MRKPWLILLLGIAIGVAATAPFRFSRFVPAARIGIQTDSLAERELERVIPKFDIDDLPFDQAIAEAQKLTKAEIVVDWGALAQSSFDKDMHISLHERHVELIVILERLLATSSCDLDATPKDDSIFLLSAIRVSVKVYDVADIIAGHWRNSSGLDNVPVEGLEALAGFIGDFVLNLGPGSSGSGYTGAIHSLGNDKVCVAATWRMHWEISRFLASLRRVAPPATADWQWNGRRDAWITPEISPALEAALRKPIDVDFDDLPLGEAAALLEKASGVSITIDSRDMPMTIVSLHGRQIPLTTALKRMLASETHGRPRGFTLQDGGITISMRDATDIGFMLRCYDVRDLVGNTKESGKYGWEREVSSVLAPISGDGPGILRFIDGRIYAYANWETHERISAALDAFRRNGIIFTPKPSDDK